MLPLFFSPLLSPSLVDVGGRTCSWECRARLFPPSVTPPFSPLSSFSFLRSRGSLRGMRLALCFACRRRAGGYSFLLPFSFPFPSLDECAGFHRSVLPSFFSVVPAVGRELQPPLPPFLPPSSLPEIIRTLLARKISLLGCGSLLLPDRGWAFPFFLLSSIPRKKLSRKRPRRGLSQLQGLLLSPPFFLFRSIGRGTADDEFFHALDQ